MREDVKAELILNSIQFELTLFNKMKKMKKDNNVTTKTEKDNCL